MPDLQRYIVVLKLEDRVADLCPQAKGIVELMTGNLYFPTPTPTIVVVTADIDALETAQAAAKLRTPGAVKQRDAKQGTLVSHLHQWKSMVQTLVDGNPNDAKVIATSVGMKVREPTARPKQQFGGEPGKVEGSADLVAEYAGAHAAYTWQWSLNQKEWNNTPVTVKARTTITGLASAVVHYFRFRAVTKDGEGPWSQVISVLVH